jgi:hypothetical protein
MVTPFGRTVLVMGATAPAGRGEGPAATAAASAQLARSRIGRTLTSRGLIGLSGSIAMPSSGRGRHRLKDAEILNDVWND